MNTAGGIQREKDLRGFSGRGLLRLGIAALAAAAVSGCAPLQPVYKTEYSLKPPATQQGRMCIMQCEQNRMQCRNNEQMKEQNCNYQNKLRELDLERCLTLGGGSCYDGSTPCDEPDFKQCDQDHRYCYQSCGGTVTSRQVCVAGWGCEPFIMPVPAHP